MYAKAVERQDAAGSAVVKGPAYKVISEQVEALFAVLEKWAEHGRQATEDDAALREQVVQELLPNIAAVRGIEPRLAKMHQKALEPDPDLQTYGPVMKEKILRLHARFLQLAALADSVEARYDETASKAQTDARAAAELARQREEEAALRAQQEEAAAILREKAQREEERAREQAEREAARALEAQRLEEARAKLVEAEERERAAALAALGCQVQEPASRWVTDPVLEGDGEALTIEKAMELEEQAAARRAALQTACEQVMRNNSPQDAYGAGETVLAYLRTILSQPRARESRRIPVENKVFHEKVGRLAGGKDVLLALGFEQEQEEGEESQVPRIFLVLNRVYIDDLRGAVTLLEGGQSMLRGMM
eukprot:Tamp_19556.p1 GENE.Tamp_19556~~Tamp_19556.p1  ORF type:complete len:380 (+),score=126.99 Tamp_19556:44-1141(+)